LAEGAFVSIACRVNGEDVTLEGHPLGRLLDALRAQLHLTGTKEGCGEGECGACSILVNGELVNSCLVPLLHADRTDIVTIEGVGTPDRLHAVQEAFIACGGAQCGICTPGMVLAAVTLLERTPNPSLEEIRSGLAGNLCRCTGYMRIFEAVVAACAAAGQPGSVERGLQTPPAPRSDSPA
jgi:carbon-monoxide dehydrogenase small subunit